MPDNEQNIAPQIHEQMESLRQRIRRYVWIEGIAVAIAWICLTFWVGLAIDYLPVRMGSAEMPRAARAVLLFAISLVLLFILYRFVMRRAFAQLRSRNLAVLVERAFPQFRDSLVTAIELEETSADTELGRSLLKAAREEAAEKVGDIDVGKVLNYRPLIRACTSAGILLLSVLLFGIFASSAFGVWFSRLYGLSDALYPRRNQIEAVGFEENQVTVARGSDLRIRVRADANLDTPPPKVCTIFFTTDRGRRGRVNMSKQGVVREGFQYYLYEGKPFRKILADVEFDVVGGDHRLSDYRVNVVDSPQITQIDVAAKLPDYTELLPKNESYHSGMQFVRGSKLELALTTNKPIVEATITDTTSGEAMTQKIDSENATQFLYRIESLQGAVAHDIELLDQDGITSARPYRVAIGSQEDIAPQVSARLQAIGSAVTPNAIIPIEGEVTDDFGIASAWVDLTVGGNVNRPLPTSVGGDSRFQAAVDLRSLRRNESNPLSIDVDSTITLAVAAQDRFNLGQDGNIGESDRYELEVVTASQLLALLEARELGLRKRFEQIITEVQETRDSLTHVKALPKSGASPNSGASPEETSEDPKANPTAAGDDAIESAANNKSVAEASLVRERALMQLRVQRAFQHSERAAQEVLGVALSFDDIRQELINNRIDSADRQTRMQRDISTPLKQVGETLFPQLSEYLLDLEKNLGSGEKVEDFAVLSIRQLDEILSIMKAIRDKMLDLETYNELIDQLRALIREQDELIDKTKKKRKQSALDLLK